MIFVKSEGAAYRVMRSVTRWLERKLKLVINQQKSKVILADECNYLGFKLRLEKLSSYIRGWMNYYALSEYYRPLPELDEWIRRRVRMWYIQGVR